MVVVALARVAMLVVPVFMMMIMAMTMIVSMLPVGALLRIERRFDGREPRAEPAQHIFDHMIAAHAQPIADDLHFDVTVSDVPGKPCQFMASGGGDLDQRLRSADDAHDAAVVQHQAVAIPQSGCPRQVEQKGRTPFARQDDTATMPLVGVEQNVIDCTGAIPLAGRLDGVCAFHVVLKRATD